jgi:hypothetical protein
MAFLESFTTSCPYSLGKNSRLTRADHAIQGQGQSREYLAKIDPEHQLIVLGRFLSDEIILHPSNG